MAPPKPHTEQAAEQMSAGTTDQAPRPTKTLYRLPKSGMIAGVCAGLADYLAMDVTLLRIIFVVLTLASGGFGILVYLIMAIALPTSDAELSQQHAGTDVGQNISNLTADIKASGGVDRLRNFFGVALVLLGAWLLLVQYFPAWLSLNWNVVWPVVLILIGLFIVARSRSTP